MSMKKKGPVKRELMFLEPLSKNSSEEKLIEKLITILEHHGINVVDKPSHYETRPNAKVKQKNLHIKRRKSNAWKTK